MASADCCGVRLDVRGPSPGSRREGGSNWSKIFAHAVGDLLSFEGGLSTSLLSSRVSLADEGENAP